MENVDVRFLGSDGQYQEYSPSDLALINKALINTSFGGVDDYIEYFIKDEAGNVLSSNYSDAKYEVGDTDPVTGTTRTIYVDPENDAKRLGFNRGIVNVKYNFFRKFLLSAPAPQQNFWISEISPSRTEIKVARQDLSNDQLLNAFGIFNATLAADAYYPDFYLNFGQDKLVIAVNALYIEEEGSSFILFKLYEPLPEDFQLKSTFWVTTTVADSAEFNVSINVQPEIAQDFRSIKGPNFKVNVNDTVNQTTPYYNYSTLFATSVSSSFQQLKSMMDEKGILINVDYSNFENFVHFSSATERVYNFVYKLQLIESASAGLLQNNTTQAKVLLQAQVDNTIAKFDGYEYYLYFESESFAWPKRNSTQPYSLYSVTSSQAINWLGGPEIVPTTTTASVYYSASVYDNTNSNLLQYTTPQYIRDDSQNAPYLVFMDMVGQHFDNIWIYLKDITNRYSAENNPFIGISMDQVGDAIKSFGVKLYTNTSITDNIYYSLLGINQTGSSLPVTSSQYSRVVYSSSSLYPLAGQPYLTASLLLPPFGEEKIERYVTTFVTGSAGYTSSFETLPSTQITDEIYKRIYHNLPYLLKTRGTERGVKALIATFGIPSNILTVHEYGGYNYLEVPGIQEISNTRILTGSVAQISSSLLSPNVTLQYYNNDLENTSINVEVGFSPADSINASITSSGYVTSSTQPGYFNIMQLIGNPALQYSSSYTPLVQVANTYFNAEYTSRYNVWDFIRVIKYYNNSIFKMLRDWVPARASADTGIVIKSHMLERNKYPRKEPTFTTSSYDADYNLVSITGSDGGAVQGNTYYVEAIPISYGILQTGSVSAPLSGSLGTVYLSSSNDVQKYTGEFSGSYINITDNYFPQEEISSYYYPWTSSVPYPSQSLFLTYSLSPIFQNVTGSVLSQRVLDLDYNSSQLAPVNYGLITQSLSQSLVIGPVSQSVQPYSQYAQFQDYNHIFRPSIIPRYSGSYLSGLSYNVYTSQSVSYSGDISYGSDPVINYYSERLGLFTQIVSSSFLPGKVNATLAYFADVSGGLFELNQNNKNWTDVQNIFKAGTTATIKQFDNKKFSNQVSTDGIKTLYNSGYNYTPQLYFSTGSTGTLGADTKLYFQFTGDAISTNFTGYNNTTPSTISGSSPVNYPVVLDNSVLRSGNIFNIFDAEDPSSTEFAPGIAGAFPSFTASQAGQKTFSFNFNVNFEFPNPSTFGTASGSYSLGAYQNGTTLIGSLQHVRFTSSFTPGGITTGSITTFAVSPTPTGTPTPIVSVGRYTGPFNWTVQGGSTTTIGDTTSQITASVYNYVEGGTTKQGIMITSMTADVDTAGLNLYNSISPSLIVNASSLSSGGSSTSPTVISTYTDAFNYTTPAISLASEDKVVFKFRQEGMSTSNFTSSVSTGKAGSSLTANTIAVGLGGYPYATASLGSFVSGASDITVLTSQIILSSNLTQYLNYQFVPAFVSASTAYTSSLYNKYGDINVVFNPQTGDKIVLGDFSGVIQEVDVVETTTLNGKLYITVTPQILDNWVLDPSLINQFLLLRKYQDEQNVILTFNKNPGATSYGFLIPETISPEVTNNINTLQAAVQSQLLSEQANPAIDTINGGTFS